MSDVLVFCASKHGHTAKVARRMAEVLGEAGREVDLCEAHASADPSPRDHDAVIVGASIHARHHRRRHETRTGLAPNAWRRLRGRPHDLAHALSREIDSGGLLPERSPAS